MQLDFEILLTMEKDQFLNRSIKLTGISLYFRSFPSRQRKRSWLFAD